MAGDPLIVFERVSKSFGPLTAVDDVSLTIGRGEFFSLLGPSGCGKTTLLRMLAGFEQPDRGRILLDGVDITAMPPHRRPVNMMFQSYALFPHMTVEKNVAFGLKQDRLPATDIAARVRAMLALVQLSGLEKRRPDQLSGGQRQRVALARALAKKPQALLLDEPLGALDRKLREETQLRLKAIQKELALTFFIVTHDQDEALTLSDRVAVMSHGKIVQVGTPQALYHRPHSVTAAAFVGDMNFLTGEIISAQGADAVMVRTGDGIFSALCACASEKSDAIKLGIRPEHIKLQRSQADAANAPGAGLSAGIENGVAAQVRAVFFRGDATLVVAQSASGQDWRVLLPATGQAGQSLPETGESVHLIFATQDALALPDDAES
ncbi:MAG: ABC transporter ATP-binding protein [Beijerinckiaceae bacterium]